ncbi:MAG: glycosyltransferase family 2 protein [Rhodospirillales bacterium]|nr:glycosyltransferase family 2 protein [Rhodospirillales bacterium]
MQADAPLVSVIIPVYNGEAFVVEAVNSALAQTYSNLEVVIVDDGSPDNAAKLVQTRYQDEARVRLVRQPNTGTAAARNTGIRYARGTLIALLDQDDRWLPEKLVRQVPLFDDPQVGLVHTGGCVVDVETGRITSTYHAAEQLALPDLVRWCKVGCATTLIRRDVLDQIGLFNPDLGGVDDWDMWIRIAAAGYKVRGIAEPLVEIREHTDNQGKRSNNSILVCLRSSKTPPASTRFRPTSSPPALPPVVGFVRTTTSKPAAAPRSPPAEAGCTKQPPTV